MSGQKRPVAAGQVVLVGAAGALLAALVGAGPAPAATSTAAVPDPVSDDTVVVTRTHISYLEGIFEAVRADRQAPGATREEVPAFGAQPLSVSGVGTVFVPPESADMVPDGDTADILAGLSASRASYASYAPADLPMPPTGGVPRLPHTVYLSYLAAEARERRSRPGCHLDWPMLAGIGEIESSQANGGRVRPDGTSYPPIYGPTLNGRNGYTAVPDSDHGRLDGDRRWDRAVGPMQFMPQTWQEWGSDGNGDGRADPQNVYDASLTAARYLCANGRDLSVPAQYNSAVLSYNDDEAYVFAVRAWARYYRQGALFQNPPRPQPPGPTPPGPQPTPVPQPGPRPPVRPTPTPPTSTPRPPTVPPPTSTPTPTPPTPKPPTGVPLPLPTVAPPGALSVRPVH
jgi:hypothetical protein